MRAIKLSSILIVLSVSILSLLYLSSFKSAPRTFSEFRGWFEQEGSDFVKSKKIGHLSFDVRYRPVELMMLNELDQRKSYTSKEIDSLKSTYGNSVYFMLDVSPDQELLTGLDRNLLKLASSNYDAFKENVHHYSFEMNEYIQLKVGDKLISPSLYHYEAGYELSEKQRFLFAFPMEDNIEDPMTMTFIYYDEIFSTGKSKFKFNIHIQDIPELPIDKI